MSQTGSAAPGRRIRLPLSETFRLIGSYARTKITEQIPSVLFIVAYLIVFQVFVLGLPLSDALVLAGGLAMVVLGLAFFLEGLALGLMPLGETIGVRLPRRAGLPLVLVFAFLMGFGATLAEPAVAALKVAGSTVKAWEAPLLFLILNKYSFGLVIAIGLGVGIAVCLGMLRFYFNWSLKPLIYILMAILLSASVMAWFVPGLSTVIGVAWDSGGITTGPVTVPLVLALGLGISRSLGRGENALSGFGVVTLASAVPIIAVLGLGFLLTGSTPAPMDERSFVDQSRRQAVTGLFDSEEAWRAYALAKLSPASRLALFDGDLSALVGHYRAMEGDPKLRAGYFSADADGIKRWLVRNGSPDEQLAFFGSAEAFADAKQRLVGSNASGDPLASLKSIGLSSVQAVLPLCLFLLLTLVAFLREKLPRPDEVVFGIAIALVGMFCLNLGIEFGLSRLGNSVGSALPSAIKAIDLPDEAQVIPHFSQDLVYHSIEPDGTDRAFFYLHQGGRTREMAYDPARYHADTQSYDLVPQRGPLLGPRSEGLGILVLILFAFIMGYGATMAEPALITMGRTVEEITVGIFRQKQLMNAVAVGVGLGIACGVLKIVWDLPLVWLLAPPYLVLLVMTAFSDENYVNIAWDSAGVTTGPVTVPLVLAMGIGLGSQVGVVEGFGVLALASAYPILVVLGMGLVLHRRQLKDIRAVETGTEG
jgi:hypothetical protein